MYLYSFSFQLCTLHNSRCKPNRNQWPSISSMNDDVSRRTNWTIARRQCLGPLGKMKSVHWGQRAIMQGAASVSSYNGGSQGLPASGKQDVVSDVLRYPRRGTVHTGWASRTLEAKEKRRREGTVRLSGHMWTPCRRWTGRVYAHTRLLSRHTSRLCATEPTHSSASFRYDRWFANCMSVEILLCDCGVFLKWYA